MEVKGGEIFLLKRGYKAREMYVQVWAIYKSFTTSKKGVKSIAYQMVRRGTLMEYQVRDSDFNFVYWSSIRSGSTTYPFDRFVDNLPEGAIKIKSVPHLGTERVKRE